MMVQMVPARWPIIAAMPAMPGTLHFAVGYAAAFVSEGDYSVEQVGVGRFESYPAPLRSVEAGGG